MSFPTSPTSGQQATEGGRLYQWNGLNAWELVANVSAHAASHAAAGSDPLTLSASQVSGLATVASSGSYDDLSNKPTIPAATTSASALTSGTLSEARLSFVPLHPFLFMGG